MSLIKKLFVGSVISVSMFGFMFSPASAATVEELQAQIKLLLAQIALLTKESPESTTASLLSIGDNVITTSNVNVRSTAGISTNDQMLPNQNILGVQPMNTKGTVEGGPVMGGIYTWYRINFSTGVDGWVAAINLKKIPKAISPNDATFNTAVSGLKATVAFTLNNGCAGYRLDWGDGAESKDIQPGISPNDVLASPACTQALRTVNLSHTYTKAGTYTLTLKRYNGSALTTTETKTMTVSGTADTLSITNLTTKDATVSLTAVLPISQGINYAVTGPIKLGTINWGDSTATVNINGLVQQSAGIALSHTYTKSSTYTITLTDLNNRVVTKSVTVSFDNAVFWGNQKLPTIDGQTQSFDAAWPKTTDTTQRFPLVLWMHGSGWYAPVSKNSFGRASMEALAKKGYVVVSMDYRISNLADPVHKNLFPSALQDVRCAVKLFRSTKYPKLPVDKNNIIVAGTSAGGNMALVMAGLSSKNSEQLRSYGVQFDSPECPYNDYSAAVQGAISVSGPVNLVTNQPVVLRKSPVSYITPSIVTITDSTKTPPSLRFSVLESNTSTKTAILNWTAYHATSCVTSGDWKGLIATTTGTLEQNIDVLGSKTFTLTCTGIGGSVSRSATVMAIHTSINYLGVQPKDDIPLAQAASPWSYFANKTDDEVPPLLFLHGTDDDTVPIASVQNLINTVLKPRHISYEVLEVIGGGHNLDVWSDSAMNKKITDFLVTN